MGATHSNGTITQTGTDTDPTVFSGLTGVTITGTNEYKVILFDGTQLIIDGTLSLPKYYRLYFINTFRPSSADLQINGTLNVDYFTTTPTGTVYHTTPWVEFGRQSTNSVSKPCLKVSGSLNWRGGSILADPTIHFESGATILFNNSVIESTNDNMCRFNASNLTFEGSLTNIGKRTTINTPSITLDNYSPKAGGGLDHGKPNTDFTLNNFSPEANSKDIALRYNNGDSIFNASTGMSLKVLPFKESEDHQHNGGGCRLYRKVSTNIKDISNNPLQSVKTFLPSYNDGNRIDLKSNFGTGWDFTAVSNTTLTTAANGKSPTHNQILKVWYLLTTDSDDFKVIRFDKDSDDSGVFTASSYKYGYLIQSNDYNLNGSEDLELAISLLPDANITESNKATVNGYSEIDTPKKFYDRAASHLEDNLGTYTDFIVTRSGNQIDSGSYNVEIDANASSAFALSGSTITIKASAFNGNITTSGVVTLSNNAVVLGQITDSSGTRSTLQYNLSGLIANSRVQLYNITKDSEILNSVISGTSYSAQYTEGLEVSSGDEIRLRVTNLSGSTAYLPFESTAIATASGFSLKANQLLDLIYNSNGIDGSSVSTLTADFPNVQIDVDDSDGICDVREIYARYVHIIQSEEGIRQWFGGITAINAVNYQVNTQIADLTIQNIGANGVNLGVARIFRDDGAIILAEGNAPITQDNGEFIQFIQPQINSAMNANAKLETISKNSKLIPALL